MRYLVFACIVLISMIFPINTALAANCPIDHYVGQSATESVLFYDSTAGSYSFVYDAAWGVTPYTTAVGSSAWTDDAIGIANASSSEWVIWVDSSGALQGAGAGNVTTSIPSGSGTYSSPSSGSTGRFSVLDGSGTVVNWGITTNSWYTSEPTATGFTHLNVGREIGCAVSDTNSTGVTCYGSYDPNGLISSASRPTTGTYKNVAVGRYLVLAVDTSGNMTGWGTASTAGFLANMPTTGVESVEVSETGELIGVAWMTDGTITIWQDPAKSLQYALRSAPGFSTYGATSDRSYVPEGPSGFITFVSQPKINIYGITSPVGAVIDNPQGLVEGTHTYAYGDAVRWDSARTLYGGVYYYWPRLIDACD
jgi:hypothetical protein